MSSGSDRSFVTGGEASPRLVKPRPDTGHTSWTSSPRSSPRAKHRRPEDSETKKMVCSSHCRPYNDIKYKWQVVVRSFIINTCP